MRTSLTQSSRSRCCIGRMSSSLRAYLQQGVSTGRERRSGIDSLDVVRQTNSSINFPKRSFPDEGEVLEFRELPRFTKCDHL